MNIKEIRIMGFKLNWFLIFSAIAVLGVVMSVFPKGMGGAMFFTLLLGSLLAWIGDHTPIVKDYLGGGSIAVIFGAAALATFNIIPESIQGNVKSFFSGEMDFINFALATLIAGSIMGTNRTILKRAAVRFLPTVIGAQLFVVIFASIGALITQQSIRDTILFIALPIVGGGMSAGAMPLSEIYQSTLGVPAEETLSIMAPSIALANALAIIFAGVISNLVKDKPKLTGYGQLMPSKPNDPVDEADYKFQNYKQLGVGFVGSFTFILLGRMVAYFIPQFHAYAYMVIIAVIVKSFALFPQDVEESIVVFFDAVMSVIKNIILCCIGITLIDLQVVASMLSPTYLIIIVLCSIGAFLGAALFGKIMGFYPVEAGISAGLCAADMGGSGDLGILGASDRMELLPFSAVATRVGGAIILIVASIVSGLLA